jgi:hypothetical protein
LQRYTVQGLFLTWFIRLDRFSWHACESWVMRQTVAASLFIFR